MLERTLPAARGPRHVTTQRRSRVFFRPGARSLQPGLQPGHRPQPLRAVQPLRDHRHIRAGQPGLRQVAPFSALSLLPHVHASSARPQLSIPLSKQSPGFELSQGSNKEKKPKKQQGRTCSRTRSPLWCQCYIYSRRPRFLNLFCCRILFIRRKKGTFVPAALQLFTSVAPQGTMAGCFIAGKREDQRALFLSATRMNLGELNIECTNKYARTQVFTLQSRSVQFRVTLVYFCRRRAHVVQRCGSHLGNISVRCRRWCELGSPR